MNNVQPDPNAIDSVQLRVLLRAFFRLNMRGALTQRHGLSQKRKFGLWGIMAFYFLMGAFIGLSMMAIKSSLFFYLIIHGMTLATIGMVVLVESGQILFNPQEPDIFGHLPVSRRTITAAKVLNITLLALLLAVSFNLVPTFVTLALRGVQPWAPLAHLLSIALVCLFCSGGVVLVYGLLARTVGRQRFDSILSWAQVALSIFFIIGYQLIFRVVGHITDIDPTTLRWLWLLPSTWFAGLDAWLSGVALPMPAMILSLSVPLLTFIVTWLGITRLAAGTLAMEQSAATAAPQKSAATLAKFAAQPLIRPVAPWLCLWLRDPAELAAFRLARAYLARDRDVRQRLYPALAMVVIFPLIILVQGHKSHDPFGSQMFIYMSFWMLVTIPTTALETLRFSTHPLAADVFRYAPLESSGPLYHGTRKAVIYYAVLPAATLLAGMLTLVLHGDVLGALRYFPIMLPLVICASLFSGLVSAYLPLSRIPAAGQQTARTQVPMMMIMFGSIGFIAIVASSVHFLGYFTTLALELPVLILLFYALRAATIRHRLLYVES